MSKLNINTWYAKLSPERLVYFNRKPGDTAVSTVSKL